jgi:hypothetical protein
LAIVATSCTPSPERAQQSTASSLAVGTIARGYGVTIKGVAYVPGDRTQSFGLVEACESRDGNTCADRSWSTGEIAAVAQAAQVAGNISGFQTRFDSNDPEVRVRARGDSTPAPACLDGSDTCWFGSTDCIERGELLLDAAGAAILDTQGESSWSLTRCARWGLEVAIANVNAWADFLKLDRLHVLRSVVLHEMGHSLGLEHHRVGLMRAHLPVCYFIDPGDPRDVFDPKATAAAFQRFDCLEGVREPELAPLQRAKLDTYQPGGPSWSLVSPGAPPPPPAQRESP